MRREVASNFGRFFRTSAVFALLGLALPGSAWAQVWTFGSGDDGTFAGAHATIGEGAYKSVTLFCAGDSPKPDPSRTSDLMELHRSDPGEVVLSLDGGFFGGIEPGDVEGTLRVGDDVWRAHLRSNMLDEIYFAELPFDDPFLAALRSGSRLEFNAGGGGGAVTLRGSGDAIGEMLAACAANFPGKPGPSDLTLTTN